MTIKFFIQNNYSKTLKKIYKPQSDDDDECMDDADQIIAQVMEEEGEENDKDTNTDLEVLNR